MLRKLLLILAVVLPLEAHAQIVMTLGGGSSGIATKYSRLGITPIDPQNVAATTTQAVGDDNADAINDYFATGWAENRLPLSIAGRRIPIGGTIVVPAKTGYAFHTTGQGTLAAAVESDYLEAGVGGMPSGLVWVNRSTRANPALQVKSYGIDWGHFRVDCNFHATDTNALVADTAHRAVVGIEIQGNQGGFGAGKHHFDSLVVSHADTGVKVVAGASELNGDESFVNVFRPIYTTTGWHFANMDSLLWHFGLVDLNQCTRGFLLESGGVLDIRTLMMSVNNTTALEVTGTDSTTKQYVHVRNLQVDNQTPDTAKAIIVNPAGGAYNGLNIIIDNFSGDTLRTNAPFAAVGATNNPYFSIDRLYGSFIIHAGGNLFEGCIESATSASTLIPTFIITHCNFQPGCQLDGNVRRLFGQDSRGLKNVVFFGCRELHGSTGSTNSGQFYQPFIGQINITGAGATNYTVTEGGYLTIP